MDGREFVSRVIEAGLIAKYLGRDDIEIIGGTRCETVELESGAAIELYQQGFHVCPALGGYTVRVTRNRTVDLEAKVSDLEQALVLVLEAHSEGAADEKRNHDSH